MGPQGRHLNVAPSALGERLPLDHGLTTWLLNNGPSDLGSSHSESLLWVIGGLQVRESRLALELLQDYRASTQGCFGLEQTRIAKKQG
jgi:hypothetical protein